jgi:hypothetical protein
MKFTIFFDHEFKTFKITPEISDVTSEILRKHNFIAAKNSLAVFDNSIYGKIDSLLHLNFAIDFIAQNTCIQHNIGRDDNTDPDLLLQTLANLKGQVPITHLGMPSERIVYVDYRSPDLRIDGISDYENLLVDAYIHAEGRSLEKKLNLNDREIPSFKRDKDLVYQQKLDGKTAYNIICKFDFHNLEHLRAIILLLATKKIADPILDNREAILASQQLKLAIDKAAFSEQLKSAQLTQWSSLFEDQFSARNVSVPQFSSDFSWIESDEYASKLSAIVAAYNQEKGFFRRNNWFSLAHSDIMTKLRGTAAADFPCYQRKQILAEYFSNLVFDTKWDITSDNKSNISASAQAILNVNKLKV